MSQPFTSLSCTSGRLSESATIMWPLCSWGVCLLCTVWLFREKLSNKPGSWLGMTTANRMLRQTRTFRMMKRHLLVAGLHKMLMISGLPYPCTHVISWFASLFFDSRLSKLWTVCLSVGATRVSGPNNRQRLLFGPDTRVVVHCQVVFGRERVRGLLISSKNKGLKKITPAFQSTFHCAFLMQTHSGHGGAGKQPTKISP